MNRRPYGDKECSTVRPWYFLFRSPAWTRRRVCSEIVLTLQWSISQIFSNVIPLRLSINERISRRRWFAAPLKYLSSCFGVFIHCHHSTHSHILQNVRTSFLNFSFLLDVFCNIRFQKHQAMSSSAFSTDSLVFPFSEWYGAGLKRLRFPSEQAPLWHPHKLHLTPTPTYLTLWICLAGTQLTLTQWVLQ